MGIWSNITKAFKDNLPSIRRPNNGSLFNSFIQEYGWSLMKRNKPLGEMEAYYRALDNPIVSRCVQVYIDESITNGWSISDPDDKVLNTITSNYLENVFNSPHGSNEPYTFSMLNHQIWTSFLITGDVFIEIDYDKVYDNILTGFHYLPTEIMEYKEDVGAFGIRGDEDLVYENDELIHIYIPHIKKKNYMWGKSIIDTVGLAIAVEFNGLRYNSDLLNNDGLNPRGILAFDKDLSGERVNSEISRLRNNKNRNGTLVLQGASYQDVGATNKDMDFISLMNYARDRIITAFGVQPSKIGVRETASLGSGTGESQDKDFHKTLAGKCKFIEDAFNKVIGRSGFREVFNYNRADFENKLEKAQIDNIRLTNGSLTINEVRASYDEPAVSWGDEPNPSGVSIKNRQAEIYNSYLSRYR